jgi:lactoylglutathione lyase
MKNLICPLLLLFIFSCQAREPEPELAVEEPVEATPQQLSQPYFDHYALIVSDLDRSAKFYEEVVGLAEIHDATEKDHIRWFNLGNGTSLHVIQSDEYAQVKVHKPVHLSLAVNDLGNFIEAISAAGIAYENWPGTSDTTNVRPDGVTQIYFQDPDGYWIEVNDAVNFR